jgi:predicted TIM-barrel fold metal-dependent hydrolase
LRRGVIDTHTHAWDAGCRVVAAHYAPGPPVPVERLVATMDAHDVAAAVLVQPSFLGTDNAYLLRCLGEHPDRLRGVAVIDGTARERDLAAMDEAGVCGIRFNLIGGGDLPDLAAGTWPATLRFMRRAEWHIELGAPGPRLPPLLDALVATRLPVVVDHLGLPDPAKGMDCAGFRALLALRGGAVVKVSAPYRLGGVDPRPLVAALADADVPMVWGSDFPHTRHEGQDYATLLQLAELLPDAEGEAEVLYGFNA